MKIFFRIILSIIFCLLIIFSASAKTITVPIDLKSMTTEELQLLSEEIDKEIESRTINTAPSEQKSNIDNENPASSSETKTSEKEQNEDKKILLNQSSIVISIDGKAIITSKWIGMTNCKKALIIPIIIENNSDNSISPRIIDISVNGWNTEGACYVTSDEVRYRSKAKGTIEINLDKTDMKEIKELSSLEFVFQIHNSKDFWGKKIIERSKRVKITLENLQ